jgi:hypothetical protein
MGAFSTCAGVQGPELLFVNHRSFSGPSAREFQNLSRRQERETDSARALRKNRHECKESGVQLLWHEETT